MRNLPLCNLFVVSLLAISAPAWADTVYKTTDKEGRTTYSSQPPATPAEKSKTKELTIDPNQNVMPADIPRPSLPAAQNQNTDTSNDAPRPSVAEAEAALRAAEQALAEGQQTQPGDFMGRSGGGVRPSGQRIDRINELQEAVDRARADLERARNGGN